jgi:threonylcarbamoyladenosine tRNA methylthiotransferase MtaB
VRVLLDSIGCRLNQSEIEHLGGTFLRAGHTLVADPDECDLAVVNTCTVTAAGAADSRTRVRRIHRANPSARVVLTGCWSTLEPERALGLPGVTQVIPNEDKEHLVPLVLGYDPQEFDLEPIERVRLPGIRMRTRAFVKAQDGCNNRCAFCQTRIARGRARSLTPAEVVRRVRAAVKGGAKEVVLTGVQLTGYGRDLHPGIDLTDLVRAVLAETAVARLRLSSLEPWGLPDRFFDLWTDHRLCRQLHLPLQSGSGATLRRMRRPTTPARFARLVERARSTIPDLALTTDLIAGFPGETEAEFAECLSFVRGMDFAKAHVFTYSPRPGTPAAGMSGSVDAKTARERSRQLRTVTRHSQQDFQRGFIGRELEVLWERAEAVGPDGWRMGGMADNSLRVSAVASSDMWNRLSRVRMTALSEDGLQGQVVGPPDAAHWEAQPASPAGKS